MLKVDLVDTLLHEFKYLTARHEKLLNPVHCHDTCNAALMNSKPHNIRFANCQNTYTKSAEAGDYLQDPVMKLKIYLETVMSVFEHPDKDLANRMLHMCSCLLDVTER